MTSRLLVLSLLFLGCARAERPDLPNVNLTVHEPSADSVESVIFITGDAGLVTNETSPLMARLRAEVEQWSRTIGRPRNVAVLYLGDNVYPVGLRDETHPMFPRDSAVLQAQLDVVSGTEAKRFQARALFLAGNHDWGNMTGQLGLDRLSNQARFIARRSRIGGFDAALLPAPGTAEVSLADVGNRLRILLIDSAWWLFERNQAEKQRFINLLDRTMSQSQNRDLVIAAHHPWSTGSAHGGLIPLWKLIGVRWLLNRSGAQLQDINSLPYRELRDHFARIFEKYSAPLVWAGGHDHAVQVIRGADRRDPVFTIVSGAASKLSEVEATSGTIYHSGDPGFVRLVEMKNGAVLVFAVAADDAFLVCEGPADNRTQCLEAGQRAFQTRYSARLK